jgi:ribosomal protein S20
LSAAATVVGHKTQQVPDPASCACRRARPTVAKRRSAAQSDIIICCPETGPEAFPVANTKSAKKQILINARNQERNVRYRTMLKNALKGARTALAEGGDAEAARLKVNHAVKTLYKSVTRGILVKHNAKRRVGRLMKAYHKQFVAPAQTQTEAS